MQKINWGAILMLSPGGLLMGYATLYRVPPVAEQLLWVPIFVANGLILMRLIKDRYFLHGFLLGIADILMVITIHIFMHSRFIATHPEVVRISGNATGSDLYITIALTDFLKGLFIAFVSGFFALILSNGIRKASRR